MVCETEHKVSVKFERLDKTLESTNRRLEFVEGVLGFDAGNLFISEYKVVERMARLEDRMGKVESNLADSDGFQPVRKR